MKTTNKMLLGVVTTLALATATYATCATNVDMGGNTISNVADPVASTDVVNKRYLEAYSEAYSANTNVPAPAGYNVIYAGGRAWLDRNVGATQASTSFTDTNAATLGSLFQWGRGADGHQFRNIPAASNSSTATASVGSGGQNECIISDDTGTSNFVLGANNSGGYNWRTTATDCNTDAESTDLWSDAGDSTFNGVCPTGWRVPSERDFKALNLSNGLDAYTKIKLSATGYRDYSSGAVHDVGSGGYYWTSTLDGTLSRYLYMYSGDAYFGSDSRAYGFSVRCLKN